MRSIRNRRAFSLFGVLGVASCTNGGTAFNPPVYVANIAATTKLQLAVGTATIAILPDPTNPTTFVGTNFVATFRGIDGHSATTANTPTLTGPPAFNFGPFLGGTNSISGRTVPQMSAEVSLLKSPTAPPRIDYQGFGPLDGVFGYGFAPLNKFPNVILDAYNANSGAFPEGPCLGLDLMLPVLSELNQNDAEGCPDSADALGQRNYSSSNNGQRYQLPITYAGGPPAWPSPQGYGNPDFFTGYPIGFTDFALPPVAGAYSLDVAFPTAPDYSTFGHVDATATLTNLTPLPAIGEPTLALGGDGSGTAFVNVPPGLFETIVFVSAPVCDPTAIGVVPGASAGAVKPTRAFYASVTHATGPVSFPFGPSLGPPNSAGTPTHTFCLASDFPGSPVSISLGTVIVSVVGFDYPAYEASYPMNVSSTPTIANATGQADVTTSYPLAVTLGSTPSQSKRRKKL